MASKIFISFLGGFVGLLTVIVLFFLSDVIQDFLHKHHLWSQTEEYLRRRRRKRKDSVKRYRAKDGQGDYLATLPEEDEVLDIEEEEEEEELALDEYVSSVQVHDSWYTG